MKFFRPLLVIVLLIAGTSVMNAQPRRPAVRHADKVHARRVIRRTAYVILAAQKQEQINKVYTGDLARAIAHQRLARKLYFRGEFLRAMHQSRRARYFAILAYQANKGTVTSDMDLNKEDEQVMTDNPVDDATLDQQLNTESPGYSTNDEDFVNAVLSDIDLGDME
ncbi:MAG TPA: hypothetical protein VL651_11020 [Bacteroidia bacterium]|jgi:hypothetical protein|nr:hypothetical protein [Bacteroidia bacterium]